MGLDELTEHWSVIPGIIVTELGKCYSLKHFHSNSFASLTNCESVKLKEVALKAMDGKKTTLKDDPTLNVVNAFQAGSNIILSTNLIGYADYTVSSYVHGRIVGAHRNNNMAPLAMAVTVYEQETGKMPVELAKINTTEGAGKTSVIGGAISQKVGINPEETVYNRLNGKLGVHRDAVKRLSLVGASIDRTDNYLELSYLAYVEKGSIHLPEDRKESVSFVSPEMMLGLLDRRIDCWKASVFYSVACSMSHFFEAKKIMEIVERQEKELTMQPFSHTFAIETRRQSGEPL